MGILNLIREQKEKFRTIQTGKQKERIMRENIKLEKERARQTEIAELNAERAQLKSDVQNVKKFNQKVEGPSKLQRLGSGLAKVMNDRKAARSGGGSKPSGRGLGLLGGINQRSSLNLGGGGSPGYSEGRGSPFSGGGKGLDLGFGSPKPVAKKTKTKSRREIIIRV